MNEIKIKRIYEEPSDDDGYRILVDRLWPRGLSKEKAQVDLWLKEIAPSHELRKWFHREEGRWDAFQKKYIEELKGKEEILHRLKQLGEEKKKITLLYGSRNTEQNHPVVLKRIIAEGW